MNIAMTIKSLCLSFIVIFSGTLCVAQVPAKKTDLTVADREAWQKVLRWPAELEEQWRRSRTTNDRDQSGLAFHSLGHGNYLVVIEVHESSYQPRYVFMHYAELGRTPARLLKLKTYELDDDEEGTISTKVSAEVEGVATFDVTKKQLVLHTKGRGTEDCGSLVRYNITSTRAIPAEVRAHACFDDYSLGVTDPKRWHKIKRL
jgi:hypothetical protein